MIGGRGILTMWLEKRAPRLIGVLLLAGSLAGCATSSFKPVEGTGSNEQFKAIGVASGSNSPALASDQQPARSGVRQSAGQARDPQAAQAVEELASMSAPGTRAYRIGPLDVLDISVYQVPDLSKAVQVADNGNINMPLIGETPASGKTSEELERELTSKLGAKYLQNPQVTVLVKEFNSSRVTISGAITKPGVYPYRGESLLQFVATAGGVTNISNSMVLVLRQTNGQRMAAKFDISAIQSGRAPDPPMEPGDVIVADTSLAKKGLNSILKVLPLASFAAI
jgi:polysaccharide biosynthesis/export protein